MTFKNDLNAQNLKTLDVVNKMVPTTDPMPPESIGYYHGEDRSPGDYCPSSHHSRDDDDNTTTSGSYTLNMEDDFDDLPPPVGYSVA